jgi:hypothetical protein
MWDEPDEDAVCPTCGSRCDNRGVCHECDIPDPPEYEPQDDPIGTDRYADDYFSERSNYLERGKYSGR